MMRDASQLNTYNYGDALYWDERYTEEGVSSFDWNQRYSALRPFLLKFVPNSSRVLMVGCGNAARPGYGNREGCSSKSMMEPVPLTETGLLPPDFVLEDPDSHYIYVCEKMSESLEGIPDQVQPGN